VLFNFLRRRAWHDYRHNQIIRQPFVVHIGTADVNCQRRATLIDQQMDFTAPFTAIHRTFPGLTASQWRGATFAINRLKQPLNAALAGIETQHHCHDLLKNAQLLPGLKPLMQGRAAHPKPVFMYRLPLTSRPQHIPDAIQDGPMVGGGSSTFGLRFRLGQ
jgi:hypothetical protein